MRADRLISLLMLLQTHGRLTADNLAQRLEVSTRTIYRDLDALSASGVPVYAERGPQGGCMLMESYRSNLTGLKEDEVRALFMITVPGLLADLGIDKASASAFLKLTASLPAPFQKDAQRVQERLYLDAAAWFQPEEPTPFLPLVQTALFQDCRLRLMYRRADGQWVKRLVAPYGLVAKAGVWYVVGAVYTGYPQVFRVSRIQQAELSDSQFSRPPSFNLAEYWQNWSAQFEENHEQFVVKVRVTPDAVSGLTRFLGEGLYDLLEESEATDKEGFVTVPVSFDSATAACEQLLGLGTAVEVLEPISLREKMRQTAVNLAAYYSQP
ncbi:MAG: YafY family transcriptional regulator [Chloroflexi bacterium]|nr:YafY family transcriptional regulator [Chloroflexota bacterium]